MSSPYAQFTPPPGASSQPSSRRRSSPTPAVIDRKVMVLEAVIEGIRERGFPLTVREIGQRVGLKSASTVHAHLLDLESMGLVRFAGGYHGGFLPVTNGTCPVCGK
jgi:SOS-response transcriptional repressor LexA